MPATRRLATPEENARVIAMSTAIGNHVFSGQDPEIIAAVLADLMSTFLLNHKLPKDLPGQAKLREQILTDWCDTVRHLVAVQDDEAPTGRVQ